MISFVRHTPSPCLRLGVLVLALVAMLALPGASGAAPKSSNDLEAYFDPEEGDTPLDLFGARFGQTQSTDLTLVIRTYAPFETSAIDPKRHRTLCVLLRSDEQPLPAGRICIYPRATAESGLGLRYTVLDPQTGAQRGIRDLNPKVARPNSTTVRVSFPPPLLRLKPGLYHWVARSQHNDELGCLPPGGCQDLLPDKGEVDLTIGLSVDPLAQERCFGAASRNARHRCANSKLDRRVVPTPDEALITPNVPCTPLKMAGLVIPCEFGVPAPDSRKTVALIGDSHAAAWRAAMESVAQEFKWRGLSITRSGCPFTKATPRLDPSLRREQCLRWNRQVLSYLKSHPEISTVFVVAHVDARVMVKRGRSEFSAKMRGFRDVWKALPTSVKRVIVIRDNPKVGPDTLSCVRRAMRQGKRRPGLACSRSRKSAVSRDAAVVAAQRLRSSKVRSIDMTSFFCSRRRCYPVVGGALVHKDVTHLTDIFASTLGPHLVRKLRALNGRT